MLVKEKYKEWKSCKSADFWRNNAATDHVVQIYKNDEELLDLVESFVVDGFNSGECVIIAATTEHLEKLNERLLAQGFDIAALKKDDLYVPLNAVETLKKFMVNNWPDEVMFEHTVRSVIEKAWRNYRKVRTFGEMVVLLWNEGHTAATIQLEKLWNKFCEDGEFSVFCAYPENCFNEKQEKSIDRICNVHMKVIAPDDTEKDSLIYSGNLN